MLSIDVTVERCQFRKIADSSKPRIHLRRTNMTMKNENKRWEGEPLEFIGRKLWGYCVLQFILSEAVHGSIFG